MKHSLETMVYVEDLNIFGTIARDMRLFTITGREIILPLVATTDNHPRVTMPSRHQLILTTIRLWNLSTMSWFINPLTMYTYKSDKPYLLE